MLQQRLEQAEAEVELLRRSVASYRTYQQRELEEVRHQQCRLRAWPLLQRSSLRVSKLFTTGFVVRQS